MIYQNRVKYTNIEKVEQKYGLKCLRKNHLRPETQTEWRCSKGHRWTASFIDVQIGILCPSCLPPKDKQIINLQTTLRISSTVFRLAAMMDRAEISNATFLPNSNLYVNFAALFFLGTHLESWIDSNFLLDFERRTAGLSFVLPFTSKTDFGGDKKKQVQRIAGSSWKYLNSLSCLDAALKRRTRTKLLESVGVTKYLIDARNKIAHAESRYPSFKGTPFNSLSTFLQSLDYRFLREVNSGLNNYMTICDCALEHGHGKKADRVLGIHLREAVR